MFERIKNFLLIRVYPLSFFMLSFCGHKQKEHKIPYEQMPIEASSSADSSTKALVSEFKQGYKAEHYVQFSTRILKKELDAFKSQSDQDPILFEQNKSLVLNTDVENLNFSNEFLSSIKGPNINKIKLNLESFIKNQIAPKDRSLDFFKNAKGLFQPLLNKRSDSNSYANLLALIASKLYSREDLRAQRLAMIFTPNSISLGFVLKDPEQGQILMAYPNTALGVKAKYYGPTSKLKGDILLIDLETFIILKSLAPSITNLDAARAFAIDQSSKRFKYNLLALTYEFKKEHNENIFELSGSIEEKIPADESEFSESETYYVEGFSELDADGIKASYLKYKNRVRREEEERRLQEERNRLGSNFELEGSWPHRFGGRENISQVAADLLKNNILTPVSDMKILTLERTRECHEEDASALAPEKANYLRDWDILGIDESWYFENLEKDDLGMCRARGHIGTDASPNLVKQYTRILQPLYLFLSANPEKLPVAEFQIKRVEIKESQQKLIREFSKKFCSQIGMVDIETQMGRAASSSVEGLWKELFHDENIRVEDSYSELVKTHNFFEIKCIFVPRVSRPEPKFEEDVEKLEASTKRNKIISPGANLIQQRVSRAR